MKETLEGIKTQGASFCCDGRYIARFDSTKRTIYRSPDINVAELQAINTWAFKKGAQTIIKCADASDFEAHDAGGDKLIENLKDVIGLDVPAAQEEIDKITADVPEITKIVAETETLAFKCLVDMIPMFKNAVKRIHELEHHPSFVGDCPHKICIAFNNHIVALDKELFHGTMAEEMEDVIDVKPTVGGAE